MRLFRLKLAAVGFVILIIVVCVSTAYTKIENAFLSQPPQDGVYVAGLEMSNPMQGVHVLLDRIVVGNGRVRVEFTFPVDGKAAVIDCPASTDPAEGYGQSLVVVVPARSFSGSDDLTLHPVDFECRGQAGRQLRLRVASGTARFWAAFSNSKEFGKPFRVENVTGHALGGLVTAGQVEVKISDLTRQ